MSESFYDLLIVLPGVSFDYMYIHIKYKAYLVMLMPQETFRS